MNSLEKEIYARILVLLDDMGLKLPNPNQIIDAIRFIAKQLKRGKTILFKEEAGELKFYYL